MKNWMTSLRSSFLLLVFMTLLLGVAYPLIVLVTAQTLFDHKANGSLLRRGGTVVGSSLLGQQFEDPGYFWGRLSATTPPYNPAASSGSNLSPASTKLLGAANARIAALQKADTHNSNLIPVDLITASGSGLDPHISLAAALYQLPRVAKARDMKQEDVRNLINQYTESPMIALLGAACVNVVKLNLALDDRIKGRTKEKDELFQPIR